MLFIWPVESSFQGEQEGSAAIPRSTSGKLNRFEYLMNV